MARRRKFVPPIEAVDGGWRITLDGEERDLLIRLMGELEALLTGPQDNVLLLRLFPVAYPEDEEKEAEYQRLMREELVTSRLSAIASVTAALDPQRTELLSEAETDRVHAVDQRDSSRARLDARHHRRRVRRSRRHHQHPRAPPLRLPELAPRVDRPLPLPHLTHPEPPTPNPKLRGIRTLSDRFARFFGEGVPESGGEHRLEGVQGDAGKPTRERGLVSRDLPAGDGEEKGNRLGVSARVPDRAVVRSLRVRRWGGSTVADRGSPTLVGVAVLSVLLVLVTALIDPATLPAIATVAALVPAAAIDVRERRLPDTWVLGAAFTLLSTTWLAWMLGQSFDARSMLLGASVMAGPMLLLHLLSPGSMGFGDVKAGVVLGAALGTLDWRLGLVALTLAAGLGVVVGAVRRSATIPFGPFLVLGATLAILGDDLWLAALSNGGG